MMLLEGSSRLTKILGGSFQGKTSRLTISSRRLCWRVKDVYFIPEYAYSWQSFREPCRCTRALASPTQIEGPLFELGPICPVFGGAACDARENVAGLFCTSRASISVHETSLLCPLVLPHPLWMPFWRGSPASVHHGRRQRWTPDNSQ